MLEVKSEPPKSDADDLDLSGIAMEDDLDMSGMTMEDTPPEASRQVTTIEKLNRAVNKDTHHDR